MWVNEQNYASQQSAAAPIDSVAFFAALAAAQQAGTINDLVPQLQFSYDSGSNVQKLTCTGILTDSMRGQLQGLPGVPPLLGTVLADVRNQAVVLFQKLASGILTVTAADLDTYGKPYIGIDASKQATKVKVQLVQTFLPLLAQKLCANWCFRPCRRISPPIPI